MSQSTDYEDLKAAIKRLHEGNLRYENYRRRVFVTSEKEVKPLFGGRLKITLDGHSTQSSRSMRALTLDGEKGTIVMLDSGDIGLRIDNTASQYRKVDIDTASESVVLQIQTVMRNWATLGETFTVRPAGAQPDTNH